MNPPVHLDARVAVTVSKIRAALPNWYRVIEILDQFQLLESLVLHEKLSLYFLDDGNGGGALHEDPLLGPFLEAGIVEAIPIVNPALNELLNASRTSGSQAGMLAYNFQQLQIALSKDAHYIAPLYVPWALVGQFLRMEKYRSSDCEVRKIEEQVSDYAVSLSQSIATTSDPLIASYEMLRTKSVESIGMLATLGHTVPIPIPPIPAIVLSEAKSLQDIGRVTLRFRDELEPSRRRFNRFDQRIRSDTSTIGEALDAAHQLRLSMEELISPDRRSRVLGIVPFTDLIDIAQGVCTNPISLPFTIGRKLVGEPLKALRRYRRRRTVAFLDLVNKRFQNIKGYSKLIERLYDFEVRPQDVTEAERQLKHLHTFLADPDTA